MSTAALVLLVLGATIVVFALDRLRVDVVALLSLLALLAVGALSTEEALAGLSAPITVMIAALFVVGEGLTHTGVAARLSGMVAGWVRRDERLLLPALMVLAAALSALMSSTGTVAVMLPVAIGLARRVGRSPSSLLMPMAFAAQLGGLLTLIGTPPNLVASRSLREATGAGLGFFDLTPYGAVALAAGILLLAFGGRWLLPPDRERDQEPSAEPSMRDLARVFELDRRIRMGEITPDSPFAGRRAVDVGARRHHGVSILALIRRPGELFRLPRVLAVEPHTRFEPGDRLLVKGAEEKVAGFLRAGALVATPFDSERAAAQRVIFEVSLVEVLVAPQSRLIGRTVREAAVHQRFGVNVVAVRRRGRVLEGAVSGIRLEFGDSLLVVGTWDRIEELGRDRLNFIVTARASEEPDRLPGASRAPWALAVVVAMLALMVFSDLDLVWLVVGAALAMVLGGAVELRAVYRVIHWPSLVMIAAMLPAATALEGSGALELLVGGLDSALGGAPFAVALLALMLVTSLLSQVISNTATAVLLAPLAVELAVRLGLEPEPLVLGVAIAASTAFATPVASPVNALVLGPGGYRFGDFLRAGVALQVLVLALAGGLLVWIWS